MSTKDKKKKFSIGKIIKNNAYMLRFIAKTAPAYIPLSIIKCILHALYAFLINTFLFQFVLNKVQEGRGLSECITFLVVSFIFAVGYYVFVYVYDYYVVVHRPKVEADIRAQLHKKAAEVELKCFENSKFYDKYIKASEETSGRAFEILDTLFWFIWNIVNTAANIVLILSISPIFVVIGIIPMIFGYFIRKIQNKLDHESDMKWRETVRQRDYVRRTFYLAEFSNEMRLTSMWKVMFKRMRDSVAELKKVIQKYGYKRGLCDYGVTFFGVVFIGMGVTVLAAYRTLVSKTILVGDCFVIIKTTTFISGNLGDIGAAFADFDEHSRYVETFREFMDYETKISEIETAPKAPSVESLEIRNVGFTYDNQEKAALKNLNFTVKKGEKIAIVGHNGAGKSTLIKLLLRLYDPIEGEILLNGENVKDFRLSTYRALFGTVFQDYGLFAVSVAQNVLMRGNVSEADREKVVDALEKSGVWKKVSSLSDGIDTTVTKEFDRNGAVFSGGETQKISIASVFAGENEIVVMDEPTSALDPIAESEMYKNMFKACEGKTVIFISHRLSSTAYADKIYVFENGEIVEQGTHHELVMLNGKFADMWHKQADNYTEKGGLKNEKD